MRKPQVRGGPGAVLGDSGGSWGTFGGFLPDFGGSGGPKKRLHFQEANCMKLSGIKYSLLKTENPCSIHGSISEKLSLYQIFRTPNFFLFGFFFGRPGFQEAGTGPGKPGRTGKYRKTRNFFFFFGQPGIQPGIRNFRFTDPINLKSVFRSYHLNSSFHSSGEALSTLDLSGRSSSICRLI